MKRLHLARNPSSGEYSVFFVEPPLVEFSSEDIAVLARDLIEEGLQSLDAFWRARWYRVRLEPDVTVTSFPSPFASSRYNSRAGGRGDVLEAEFYKLRRAYGYRADSGSSTQPCERGVGP